MNMYTNGRTRRGTMALGSAVLALIVLLLPPVRGESFNTFEAATAPGFTGSELDDAYWYPATPAWLMAGISREVPADYAGRLRATLDYRSAGEDEDLDAYGTWFLRGKHLLNRKVDFYGSGKLHQDLDDGSTSQDDDVFSSVQDTDSSLDSKLFQLYFDLHTENQLVSLRAGRQYVDIADFLHIDGLQVMAFERERVGGRVFAGQAVNFYSSESDDLLYGGSVVGRPWEGNQSRFTYANYHADGDDLDDEHLFLDVRQELSEALRVRGQVSVLNDDLRMLGFDLFYVDLEEIKDLVLGVRRWESFEPQTRAYSPFFSRLGEQEPYTHAHVRATRGLLSWLLLSPGIAYRLPDDESSRNREYGNYDLTFIVDPQNGWDGSVALEYWDVQDGDSFAGLSGEIRYRWEKVWELSAGAAYLHYEYAEVSDFAISIDGGSTVFTEEGIKVEESPDSLAYYLRGKWNITKNLTFWLRGEIEDNDLLDDLAYRGRTSLAVKF